MNTKISNRNILRFILKLLSYAKLQTFIMFLLLLVNTILMYAVPVATEKVVDGLLAAEESGINYGIVVGYALLLLLSAVAENLERYISVKHSEAVANHFRIEFFHNVLRHNYVKFNRNTFGDVETAMTSCIADINDSTYCFFETLIIYPIGLGIGVAYISNISYWLLLILLSQLLLNYLIMHRGSLLRRKLQKESYHAQGRYSSVITGLYHAYENIRLLSILTNADKKHEEESDNLARSTTKVAKVSNIYISLMLDISDVILNVVVIFVFIILVQRGQSSIGSYLAFVAMKDVISGCFNGFAKLKVNKATFDAAIEQINAIESLEDFLNYGSSSYRSRKESMLPKVINKENNIVLSHVEYAYPNSSQIFRFDYVFRKNKCYLIIGANGTGKSTFVRLMAGMLRDNSFIEENDDSQKVLPQSIQLFDESIMDILIDESVVYSEEVATRLGVFELINRIKEKKENTVSISSLSGGEKKKILLSLILGQTPDILILDEPFAEIDADSKVALAEVICDSIKDRIVIVISHEIPDVLEKNATLIHLEKRDNISQFEL